MALLEQVGGTATTSGISRLTLEHLFWKITSDTTLSDATDTVSVAFAERDDDFPADSDWHPAEIVEDPEDDTKQAIRLLVGPSAADLTPDPATSSSVTYRVWVKISLDDGQEIVRRVGTLVVR